MKFLPFVLALSLTACAGGGGKPTQFLRLTPDTASPSSQPAASAEHKGAAIAVAPVELPPTLDRTEFTTAGAGAQLNVTAEAKWAGSLADMIRLVLAQDLAAHAEHATVLMPGDPVPNGGAREVHVTVQNFLPDAKGAVTLEASWWLTSPDGHTVLHRDRFQQTLPGAPTPAAEAETMSRALAELAKTIGQRI